MFAEEKEEGVVAIATSKSNILQQFSLTSQRDICETVCRELKGLTGTFDRNTSISSRLTKEHLKWDIMVIGHAFSLPFNSKKDTEIVKDAIDIYEAWLSPPDDGSSAYFVINPTNHAKDGDLIGISSISREPSMMNVNSEGLVKYDGEILPTNLTSMPSDGAASDTAPTVNFVNSTNNVPHINNYHILEPTRPTCLVDYEQEFIQSAIEQFALLFEDRPALRFKNTSKEQGPVTFFANIHVQLCDRVLIILNKLAHERGPELSVKTWEKLLVVILGICENVLNPTNTIGSNLADANLRAVLTRVLFSLWLRSSTRRPQLWTLLRQSAKSWRSCRELIEQWGHACTALTRRAKCILWPLEGAEPLQVTWWKDERGEPELINLDDESVLFVWHKMLYIIGNPNDIETPGCFVAAMTSLACIVDEFNSVGNWQPQNNNQNSPTGGLPSKTPQPKSYINIDGGKKVENRRSSLSLSDTEDAPDDSVIFVPVSITPKGVDKHNRRYTSAPLTSQKTYMNETPPANVGEKSNSPAHEIGSANANNNNNNNNNNEDKNNLVGLKKVPAKKDSESKLQNLHFLKKLSVETGNEALSDFVDLQVPPEANSILKIFGAWLFDAATNERSMFEMGRAQALGALTEIFCNKTNRSEISNEYTTRYFDALERALNGKENHSIARVMILSNALFSCNLVGSRMLIPYFEQHCKDILLGPGSEKDKLKRLAKGRPTNQQDATMGEVPLVKLRSSCISLLSCLLPLPNHFQEWDMRGLFYTSQTMHKVTRNSVVKGDKSAKYNLDTMQENEGDHETDETIVDRSKMTDSSENHGSLESDTGGDGSPFPVLNSQKDVVYDKLRGWLGKLLVDSLKAETEPSNTQNLLWSVCVKVLEDADISPGIAQIVISTLCQILIQKDCWWTMSVQLTAIYTLCEMSRLHAAIQLSSTATMPHLLKRLSEYAKLKSDESISNTSANKEWLASAAIECIWQWVANAPWLLNQLDLAKTLVHLAVRAAGDETGKRHRMGISRNATSSSTTSIKSAGANLLRYMVKKVGMYPYKGFEPCATSSNLNEEMIICGDMYTLDAFEHVGVEALTVKQSSTIAYDPIPFKSEVVFVHSQDVDESIVAARTDKYVRHFIINESTILTIIERPGESYERDNTLPKDDERVSIPQRWIEDPYVIIIIRGPSGKISWRIRPVTSPGDLKGFEPYYQVKKSDNSEAKSESTEYSSSANDGRNIKQDHLRNSIAPPYPNNMIRSAPQVLYPSSRVSLTPSPTKSANPVPTVILSPYTIGMNNNTNTLPTLSPYKASPSVSKLSTTLESRSMESKLKESPHSGVIPKQIKRLKADSENSENNLSDMSEYTNSDSDDGSIEDGTVGVSREYRQYHQKLKYHANNVGLDSYDDSYVSSESEAENNNRDRVFSEDYTNHDPLRILLEGLKKQKMLTSIPEDYVSAPKSNGPSLIPNTSSSKPVEFNHLTSMGGAGGDSYNKKDNATSLTSSNMSVDGIGALGANYVGESTDSEPNLMNNNRLLAVDSTSSSYLAGGGGSADTTVYVSDSKTELPSKIMSDLLSDSNYWGKENKTGPLLKPVALNSRGSASLKKILTESQALELLNRQGEYENQEYESIPRTGVKYKVFAPSVPDAHAGDCKWQLGRRAFAQCGLLSVNKDLKDIQPLEISKELREELASLDKLIDRRSLEVNICYASSIIKDDKESLHVSGTGSESYQKFLLSLGWPVKLSKGQYIRCAGAEEGDKANQFIFQDHEYSILFTSEKPETDTNILVLWNDTKACYQPKTNLWRRYNLHSSNVVIIIDPMQEELYRIRTFKADRSQFNIGPLTQNMVVANRLLGFLVRRTIIRCYSNLIESSDLQSFRPFQNRRVKIKNLGFKYGRKITLQKLYGQFFLPSSSGLNSTPRI